MKTQRQLKKLSEVVKHTANMVIITDILGNIEYVNPKFTELMGYTLDEVVGQNIRILNSGIQPTEYYKELWETIQKGEVWNGEFINKTKQGKLISEKARISPVKDKNGNILSYISIKEDITEQLKADKALKESREMQEIILNGIDEALYLSSYENDILYMNDAMKKKIGIDAVGNKCYHAIYNKDSVCENCYFGTLKEKGKTVLEIEEDGRKYKISSTLLKNNSKLTVYYDITDRKENEKLKKAQKELIISENALKKSYKDLKIAKGKAEESDRLKTLFLANMSHEIRTPMNGIIGFANLLSDPKLTENQKNKYVEVIQNSSNHLLNIITDIMDIAKIEARQLKTKEIRTNINDMVSDLISLYHLPAQKKSIQLSAHNQLIGSFINVYTDYTKVRQVLENLVGNALKFTDKGYIKVGYEVKGKKLLFSVEDTGIGIRLEYQKTIFDRFSQADNSSTRIYGGTGLGLSISQAYIHELGGDIWLKSEPEKGTTFYFTIPYYPVE